jgi:hypothetical protein
MWFTTRMCVVCSYIRQSAVTCSSPWKCAPYIFKTHSWLLHAVLFCLIVPKNQWVQWLYFQTRNMPKLCICMAFVMIMHEQWLKNINSNSQIAKCQTDECSAMCTGVSDKLLLSQRSVKDHNNNNAQVEDDILEMVQCSPTTSIWRITNQLGTPQTRVCRTVHDFGLQSVFLSHPKCPSSAAKWQLCMRRILSLVLA